MRGRGADAQRDRRGQHEYAAAHRAVDDARRQPGEPDAADETFR
jgi:hypothetical protein